MPWDRRQKLMGAAMFSFPAAYQYGMHLRPVQCCQQEQMERRCQDLFKVPLIRCWLLSLVLYTNTAQTQRNPETSARPMPTESKSLRDWKCSSIGEVPLYGSCLHIFCISCWGLVPT